MVIKKRVSGKITKVEPVQDSNVDTIIKCNKCLDLNTTVVNKNKDNLCLFCQHCCKVDMIRNKCKCCKRNKKV